MAVVRAIATGSVGGEKQHAIWPDGWVQFIMWAVDSGERRRFLPVGVPDFAYEQVVILATFGLGGKNAGYVIGNG